MINVKVTKTFPKKPKSYPKLMQMVSEGSNKGALVLMARPSCGINISHTNNPVGEYSEYWDMSQFEDFNGAEDTCIEAAKRIEELEENLRLLAKSYETCLKMLETVVNDEEGY